MNNAAILRDAFVFNADPRDWDAVIRNNLSAPFYLTNAAASAMREQGNAGRGGAGSYDWGRIVNIVSSAGLYGSTGTGGLCQRQGRPVRPHAHRRRWTWRMRRSPPMPWRHSPHAGHRHHPAGQRGKKTYKARALEVGAHHVAALVTALCSPAGRKITGQLLGVRGREVFLFGQPRPVGRLEAGAPAALAEISSPGSATGSPTSPPASKPSTPNRSSEEFSIVAADPEE